MNERLGVSREIEIPGMAFYLQRVDNSRYDIMSQERNKVGVITLNFNLKLGFYSIKVINIENKVRGQNLGSKAIVALSNELGEITSSPDGQTSDAAYSMWKRIDGAIKKPYNNKLGYVYSVNNKN